MQQAQKTKLNLLLQNTADIALRRRARKIIEEINPKPNDKILEIGCGDGYYLNILFLLENKAKYSGVDIDKNSLSSAKRNLKGKNINLYKADLMKKLPFVKNSFDKVIMSEVAEHLSDDAKGIREARRVLKPNGLICISVPSANYPFLWDPVNWVIEHLTGHHIKSGFWAGIWNQHLRLYKPEHIRNLVNDSGFKVKKTFAITQWSLPFNHNIINLGARMLARGARDSSLIAGANKFSVDSKKSGIMKFYYGISNFVDKLNDRDQSKGSGVSNLVVAEKI